MAGYGIPEADIATVLEIDAKTLRKHYRRQLDKGHIKATAKVAENLYRKATGEGRESVIAAIDHRASGRDCRPDHQGVTQNYAVQRIQRLGVEPCPAPKQ